MNVICKMECVKPLGVEDIPRTWMSVSHQGDLEGGKGSVLSTPGRDSPRGTYYRSNSVTEACLQP
ncbi:Uncharacterized protein DAT39_017007, partial [Clarias magur]